MADDIAQWLEGLGLGQYAQAFAENAIVHALLPKLTDDDLKELGVAALGHRKLILGAIEELSVDQPKLAPDTSTGSPSHAPPEAERRRPDGECDCIAIRAPVSGRILRILHKSEGVVAAGEALLEIGDPEDLEIVVDLLSNDAVRVVPGQRVVIEEWGGDAPLRGWVRRVEPYGFTKISALGIEEQRVNVIIDLGSPPEDRRALGHGYRVEARIVLWEGRDVLTAPLGALFRDGAQWAVFVAVDGRAEIRHVALGRRNTLEAEITNGLAAGERLILHPSERIVDGGRIRAR